MFWSCNNHDCRIDAVFVLLIIYIFCSKSAITQENRRNWKHQDRRGMDSWAQRYEKRNIHSDKSLSRYIRCIDMFICTHIHPQTYGCKCANWGGPVVHGGQWVTWTSCTPPPSPAQPEICWHTLWGWKQECNKQMCYSTNSSLIRAVMMMMMI